MDQNAFTPVYAPGTVHAARLSTDAQFIDDGLSARFTGRAAEVYALVRREQAMNAPLWRRFADQFRLRPDAADGGWRGEYWGKTMRAAAFLYSYYRDDALYETLKASVEDLLSTADDTGRISSYGGGEGEFGGWDLWCRKYVLLGLQYFLEICKEPALSARILAVMKRQADLLYDAFGPESGRLLTEATSVWRGLAASSLLEPVVRLYDLTGEKKYLGFAAHIVSLGGTSVADIFELAYADETDPYQYPMTKAYEMISCFEGLLEYYRATGIEKYKTAVLRFAERAANAEITVIGSAGCTHELFDHAARRQTDTSCKDVMQETCVTVTWMKFCLQLLCLTGDPRWADRFETSFYNAYLGAVNADGAADAWLPEKYPRVKPFPLPFSSYAPLRPDVRGRRIGGLCVMDHGAYYGCCAAIGGAGIGMLHKAAVTRTRDGVAVNLFIPGGITTRAPSGAALSLRTETAYPAGGEVRISVSLPAPETFTLSLRIPPWSEKTSLTVNGEPVPAAPGGYARLEREWAAGDVLALELDMRVRALRPEAWTRDLVATDYRWRHNYMVPRVIVAPPDLLDFAALRRGPLILARDKRLGEEPDSPASPLCGADGTVAAVHTDAPFPHLVALSVPDAGGGAFRVVDYASAGKTLDEHSRCGCWFPTK